MYDLIFRNGLVIDGSGAAAFRADVGVRGSQIAAVGDLSQAEAAQVVDASGLMVAPGFIDMHSHGDFMLPFLPTADSKVQQGITLEVVGNCGSSMAPLSPAMAAEVNQEKDSRAGQEVTWETFGEFLDTLRRQGTALNVVALVGHGTVREKVMGMTDAAPTPEQLAAMQDEVRAAMQAGARGLSTGLIYTPNVYAKTDEIVALARTAAEMGGIYTSHVRGEGNSLLEAVDEAIQVGREAGISVEVSHLKASGVRNWDKMALVIEKIQKAREEGLNVNADMYPYPASNTGLSSLIPDWAHVGGREAMVARLQDPALRAQLRAELHDEVNANGVGWDRIFISDCPSNPRLEGRHLGEIAAERGVHPWEAVFDILIETRCVADMIMFTMQEENVALGLQQPWVMIGTDASGRAAEGPFSAGKPHPRNYGSFPRVLGYYARQQELFSVEEAVRKMTSLPASKLGLTQRGYLRPGCYADMVVFDAQAVIDRSTFQQPHQYPQGIRWVVVNGQVVVKDGQHTGALPGQIL
ncbi:N-acyl-D-amino-acid deacylase family protein [Levilinea saccharolytica]|uniref:N-acyl-D-aspartate/D-glutamate deacylase n=1 Tax=Levilinea saccharolytica TaxID=229921 RepID=A0A0M9U3E4_9CHLR|nr:D-aminoacylase [Levilinea saccharolytica]KPL87466.1 hypothetical protein ADN01_04765 [Levilinea saccharolytica]GAP19683.1 N-acyl-D-aspartate/D-glutamate deacylase [Levilinea saccharolytica]